MQALTTPTRSPARAVAAGITAMALVGGSVGVSRTLVDAPLFTTQAVRYTAAIAVLALVARLLGVPVVRPRGREWWWLAGIAATGLVLFNVAVVRGVAHAEPAVVAVAVACVPVVIGVVGPLLERRTPQGPVLVAAVVVTAGAALVEGAGRADAEGVAWAAVAMACEAAFTLLAIPVLARHGAWGVSLHSVWLGAVMFGALALVAEGAGAVASVTAAEWAAVAYLAVLVTAVAFVLWYSTVAALGSGPVGLLTGVAPVAAALAGIAVGSRAPGPLVWAGMAVVVLGLALGLRGSNLRGSNLRGPDLRRPGSHDQGSHGPDLRERAGEPA
ncbi:EamA family transporter [Saccharothrix sp. Mg75]|uniref:EamA family transporter n=1 Tax=Saccharothrix sp. Mg75 TaxID=3445357 RepID=UPI003EEC5E65